MRYESPDFDSRSIYSLFCVVFTSSYEQMLEAHARGEVLTDMITEINFVFELHNVFFHNDRLTQYYF
jgi:hypothetical protein